MNKEEAKRYLFERIPALENVYPGAKYAYLYYYNGKYCVSAYDHDSLEDGLKMEIPRDENGKLELKAEFSRYSGNGKDQNIVESNYFGLVPCHGSMLYIADGGSIFTEMTPIYPEEKPKMVDWDIEDFRGQWLKFGPDEYIVTSIHTDDKKVAVAGSVYSIKYIFANATQLDGKPLKKEVK